MSRQSPRLIKRCPYCNETKPVAEFWKRWKERERYQSWCKACVRAWRLSYREIERDQDRARYRRRLETLTSGGPPAQVAGEY